MDIYRPKCPLSIKYNLCYISLISISEKDRLEVDNLQIQYNYMLVSCPYQAPSILTQAIIQGKSCFVQCLIRRFPVYINRPDWNNQRPIMVAIEYRQHKILQSITPLQSTYQRKRRRHDPEKNKISPNEPTNVKLYIGILSGQIIGDRSRLLDPTPVFHSCPVPAKGLTIPRLSEPRLQAVIWHNYVGDRPSEVSGGTH